MQKHIPTNAQVSFQPQFSALTANNILLMTIRFIEEYYYVSC